MPVLNFDEIAEKRKSIRAYKSDPIPAEALEAVLKAGITAPSARNLQNLKFIVVNDRSLADALVDACNGQKMVGEAPVFIAVCATENRIMACGQPTAQIDASIAMSFMILKAAELGLGSCWIGSFSQEKLAAILGVPEGVQIVAVTPLGYPAEKGRERVRKPYYDIVCFGRFKP